MTSRQEYSEKSIDQTEIASTQDFDANSPTIRRVRRKADLHLIPIFALLYLFSFLDRVNIGNAKVAGIEKSLGMTSAQFNMALTIFFIGYILFEVPSNLMLKIFGPKWWITIVIVTWGAVMTAMAACKNYKHLYVSRFFLGLAEAGLLPGVIYMISVWYTRREIAFRNGLFFSMASFAGAFSGILAFLISKMDGTAGLRGWQWIFIIEGGITILLGPLAFFGLPTSPATAYFLTPEERELTVARLRHDAGPAKEEHFSWKQFLLAVTDWQTYMFISGYFLGSAPLYALSLFLPAIIHDFHFSTAQTNLMTVPAFFCAALCCLTCAWSSDRRRERALHITIPMWIGALGYVLLIVCREKSVAVRYVCLTITVCGVFSPAPAMFAWFSGNFGGKTKKAVAVGLIVSCGCIGGVLGSYIYRAQDGPMYVRGHAISAAMTFTAGCLAQIKKQIYIHENRRRDRLTPEQYAKEAAGEELCDRHPDF
ncbi:hypothetical protein BGW42_003457, partial [Actinomortierella wolfii]